jgi:hypothetical protein
MENTPHGLAPLDQVRDEEKMRQNGGNSKPKREDEIECGVHKGPESHLPQFIPRRDLSHLALPEAEIGVDDARGTLEPDQDPQPPAQAIIMTHSNSIGGRRCEGQHTGGNDLDVDLLSLFPFTDEP